MQPFVRAFAQACAAFCLLAVPRLGHAKLESCGGAYVYPDIYMSGDAACEVVSGAECAEKCDGAAVQRACAAQLFEGCQDRCVAEEMDSCLQRCEPTCVGECNRTGSENSASFTCRVKCESGCDAHCAGASDRGACFAACAYSCNSHCDDSCSGSEPGASCEGKCASSCEGSCTAGASMRCQIACETEGFDACRAALSGSCRSSCENQGAAIFCAGQFLNAPSLSACAAELESEVGVQVGGIDEFASLQKAVIATEEEAGARHVAGATCSVGSVGPRTDGSWAWVAAAVVGLSCTRRRLARSER